MLKKLVRVMVFSAVSTGAAWAAGHLAQIAGPVAGATWWPVAVPIVNATLYAIEKWAKAQCNGGAYKP